MGSLTLLKDKEFFSLSIEEPVILSKKDIKDISKELCQAHQKGSLPTETLQEIIEHLLVCYMEQDLERKLFSKIKQLELKINRKGK
ncbi:MAG: hypothetical protein GY804_15550 [Alphaproteobacteria bacterium]|nr:hypothetical protein [Alphaproteobacteria bacterium]